MNANSLKLIEDVIINFGKFASIEIAQDSIYIEFRDVELGVPKSDEYLKLAVRFGDDSFLAVFYNNIWDIEFLSKYNYKKQILHDTFLYKVTKIKFNDFEFLNKFFYTYKSNKIISSNDEFDIHNIRNDYILLFECDDIAVCIGANQMDFFSQFERLDDDSLKRLSNDWMVYFLSYQHKRNLIKDPMCENHPFLDEDEIRFDFI